jgi:hypothetical protein
LELLAIVNKAQFDLVYARRGTQYTYTYQILGHHRMSQGNATRGIEIGQEFGQQPQIEVVATNVEIPIGYPIIPVIGSEERPNNTNPSIPITEPPREEQPRVEKPITEPPRIEQPRVEQTVIEPPRVEPPQFEQPRVEAPRFEQPRVEPPRVEPPRFKQPRMEPPRVKPPQFEQPRMEPPRFKQPRMESPRMGQPQFGFPRMEPFQQGIGQLEAGFRFEPPQRFGPIRNEPYKE